MSVKQAIWISWDVLQLYSTKLLTNCMAFARVVIMQQWGAVSRNLGQTLWPLHR